MEIILCIWVCINRIHKKASNIICSCPRFRMLTSWIQLQCTSCCFPTLKEHAMQIALDSTKCSMMEEWLIIWWTRNSKASTTSSAFKCWTCSMTTLGRAERVFMLINCAQNEWQTLSIQAIWIYFEHIIVKIWLFLTKILLKLRI